MTSFYTNTQDVSYIQLKSKNSIRQTPTEFYKVHSDTNKCYARMNFLPEFFTANMMAESKSKFEKNFFYRVFGTRLDRSRRAIYRNVIFNTFESIFLSQMP